MEEQGLWVSLDREKEFQRSRPAGRLCFWKQIWVFDLETLRPGKDYTLEFRYERYYD